MFIIDNYLFYLEISLTVTDQLFSKNLASFCFNTVKLNKYFLFKLPAEIW